MCVNTQNHAWERPATVQDCAVFARHFPGVDFVGILNAMSQDKAVPLTTDLALMGAMLATSADDLGMRYVPFCGAEKDSQNVVKLPVMEQIVDWFENTALGSDMWKNASDWSERTTGMRVHFAMNCGCGLVATTSYRNGQWTAWKERFNASRSHLFGRTTVVRRVSDTLEGLDITPAQLDIWRRVRAALEALPAVVSQQDNDARRRAA